MNTDTFPENNTVRASRRATLILLSLVLAFLTGVVAQAAPSKGKQASRATKARSVASSKRGAQKARLAKVAKRGNPLASEEGERAERRERGERHGKRAARSERTDKPAEAVKAELEKRLPKGATELPVERYFEAKEQMKQMQRYSTSTGETLPSEAESGASDAELLSARANAKGVSAPSLDAGSTSGVLGTWQALGPGNVGGRTRAIIIDPVTPNTMYAAGVVAICL